MTVTKKDDCDFDKTQLSMFPGIFFSSKKSHMEHLFPNCVHNNFCGKIHFLGVI